MTSNINLREQGMIASLEQREYERANGFKAAVPKEETRLWRCNRQQITRFARNDKGVLARS